ncbi:hypothetical protein [Sinorhizobium americanum]|uniref:Uncharacterized protein n=1 Tax=Sinorhizobium americanum TaxID=194963 RepID=A0A4R2BWA3_9HYPH|nr:hypothetical protein [Sinorhizobium americanum]TCN30324.1 hypothetical protein EV184_108198 [Sinorhizobium americanum]
MRAMACGLIVAWFAAVPAAAAKVELAKPETRGAPAARLPIEPDMSCMRPPKVDTPQQWIVWTIRAADGTVLAIGATEVVRQRC